MLRALDEKNIIDYSVQKSNNCTIRGCRLHGQVTIGENVHLHRTQLTGPIKIGNNTTLYGPNILVFAKHHSIEIGNYCSIAPGVIIQEYFHDSERLSTYFVNKNVLRNELEETISKGPIAIGHDVWIGANAIILSGVKVGNGAIIGAGSVVTKDVPEFAIVGGNPAKFIRMRFTENEIQAINELQWWNWSEEEVKKNQSLFESKFKI